MSDVLERFGPATQDWFRGAFPQPTDAQIGAWDAISHGRHALVVAPTGSGKTLSAFLWAIDRVFREKDAAPRRPPAGRRQTTDAAASPTRILYISPLKALGVDVERNLRSPLVGIGQSAGASASRSPGVSVGVRSGDTTSSDRRKLVTAPPDILITTPESLYLMLTSQAGRRSRRAHRDHRRGACGRRDQARRAPRRQPRAARRAARQARRSGSACRRLCGRSTRSRGSSAGPRRSRSSRRERPRRSTCAVIVPVDDMLNPPPPPGSYGVEPSGGEALVEDEDWFADPRQAQGPGAAQGPGPAPGPDAGRRRPR